MLHLSKKREKRIRKRKQLRSEKEERKKANKIDLFRPVNVQHKECYGRI